MTSRYHIFCAAALLVLSASPWLPAARAAVSVPSNFVNDLIVGGLDQPTGFAFLPDGRMLVCEQKTGRVRMVVGGHIAASDPTLQIGDANISGSERGMQGIAVDPGWPFRPYIYLYYTRLGGTCRLVRYTAGGDLNDTDGEGLWLYGPLVLMDDIPDTGANHNGGGLRFGPGSTLYVALGDDDVPCAAADSGSLRGAILRLSVGSLPPDSGSQVPRFAITPPDNPFPTSSVNARLVWLYGLRNPWRFSPDSLSGAIYISDVGETSFEEIDEGYPGDFLGWPYREGNQVMIPGGCAEPGGPGSNSYKRPITLMPHGAGATAIICAGMYRPSTTGLSNWPVEYWGLYGDVFYGEYYSGVLRRLKRQAGQWNTPAAVAGQPDAENWATGLTTAVDFRVGPDGSLWWLAQFDATFGGSTGSLQRIRYSRPQTGVGDGVPSRAALASAPNPFSSHTDLSFRLERPVSTRLDVYDLAGRRVRALWRGVAPAGETRVRWSGEDDAGGATPPGVYLARLEGAGVVTVARVLRVR